MLVSNPFLQHVESCVFCKDADIWNALEVELCLDGKRLLREVAEEHAQKMECKR